MSKMKHLLRKLHIGGGLNEHQRLAESRPTTNPSPTQSPSPSPNTPASSSSSSGPSSTASGPATMGRIGADESVVDRTAGDGGGGGGDGCVDFNFMEEEFQVQLALAISASDPDAREDSETAQIDAAKQISLGCSAPVSDSQAIVKFLSLRYWNYNVVSYHEKVMDGFYDVYGITSKLDTQGKMPLLVDLQAISISDNVDYEVIFVNRLVDRELQKLEKIACTISKEYRVSEQGQILSGLIQKIADLVVDRMGGVVLDADEMLRRWNTRSYELRNSLNTIILPLGCLDVGLSRHRALLFKVLADRINLPCTLVKGSYYTGTDDGAVNFIKMDDGSEYIIDLMGAPGTLIPAEVPSSQLPNPVYDVRSYADVIGIPTDVCLMDNEGNRKLVPPDLDRVFEIVGSKSDEASVVGMQTKENQTEIFENQWGKLLPSLQKTCESSSGTCGKASSAQKKKVKDVSKYVISAAKNPEFAQKLHAVLLESGASPPPDLFSDINPHDLGQQKLVGQNDLVNAKNVDNEVQYEPDKFLSNLEQSLVPNTEMEPLNNVTCDRKQKLSTQRLSNQSKELETTSIMSDVSLPSEPTTQGFVLVGSGSNDPVCADATGVNAVTLNNAEMVARALHDTAADSCQRQVNIALVNDDQQCFLDKIRRDSADIELGKESVMKLTEAANTGLFIASDAHGEGTNPVLGEVAEWEIPWEDLRIGERIGIGSYGEVYRADWNGTEVAVKKFLDQGLSGDALVQVKSEVEIMLRLRHPNVVLFMGAVTRPPHFSILTEFLPRGSLYRLLHRPNSPIDEKRRMRMARDVARGMNYLHTSHPPIVHRDLKSPNLLVDKNWVVKVCDFGLSRMKHHTFLSSKSTAGTPEWMAPEVLRNEQANEKCDVYSFGVILWELSTLRIPWKGLNPMQVVGAVGFQNRRLEIQDEVDPAVAEIIHDCWQTDPQLRPSFAQLYSRLCHLQRLVVSTN
ncbi:probable serine/threonine-protein kinase SIS8 isoform X1 [Juglans microcarpa x Juglans regia]|uniref:probable serine/threonine-protein kinase SIS8 isoform X1 n=1 Tax=Juglans microcarpa x Juglans regia TaxID=2249226 RepID=UPI001B7EDF75|nr:probable serine/threonine-protein kinase SIS8 isoform X1 [Juglans microcarpa x Juglans regia]